jgi:Cobalamin-independent synthase, N-terminal domain
MLALTHAKQHLLCPLCTFVHQQQSETHATLSHPVVCRLPVQAVTLDFLGVPGSAQGCKTLDLIKKHGFPSDKRLGAGVVDGRSVYADNGVSIAVIAELFKQVGLLAVFAQHDPIVTSADVM